MWESTGDGHWQFFSNEEKVYNYTFFLSFDDRYEQTMNVVESVVKKLSGCRLGGFGITFCYQNIDNLYCLFIDIDGWFWVSKRVDGEWLVIRDPEQSNQLILGYARENILRVKYDSNDRRFELYFNGSLVDAFYDNSFHGGYSGFAASVLGQEYEEFPDVPVDVRARRVLPALKGPSEPSPPDGVGIEDRTPVLSWSTQDGMTSFHIQMGEDEGFSDSLLVDNADVVAPNYHVTSPLMKGTTYYWRVKAKNPYNESREWSDTWSFTVGNAPITNPHPSNGSATPYTSPLLDWNDVWGVTGYHVQVITDYDFTGTIVAKNDALATSQYQLTNTLLFNSTYYWRVRVKDADGAWGDWGNSWSFTVANNWSVTIGGALDDYAVSQCRSQDGGVIATGMTESYGSGSSDFLLTKLRYDGTLEWANCYGGTEYDHPAAVRTTSDGGYILAGYTSSYGIGSAANCWILKLDSSGLIDWQQTYGGTINDIPNDIQETSDGGYVVTGYTQSFAPVGATNTLLLKLSGSGMIEWSKTYGSSPSATVIARAIKQTADDGYVLAGNIKYATGVFGFCVLRLTSDGSIVWQKRYGGSALYRYDIGQSIIETNDGKYLVAGITESFGSGKYDIWLLKLDENGNVMWAKAYGGTSDDSIEATDSVSLSNDGTYTVAGTTMSFGSGDHNGLVLKLDSDGNPIWSKMYSVEQSNVLVSLGQVPDGEFVAVGSATGSAGRDFWVIRFHGDGSCGGLGTSVPLAVTITAAQVADTSLVETDRTFMTSSGNNLVTAVSPSWHRQVP
jgi:uncharacterized delta-60 repeat protein